MRSLISTACVLAIAVSTGCSREPSMAIPTPARLVQALDAVDTLEARARLLPTSGNALADVSLTAAADGASFAGFVEAPPGDYTLELRFYGTLPGGTAPLFLGLLVSDQLTVSEQNSTTARFSRPLDPMGAPEDMADTDADQLAALDELLWGTNLELADSDNDGLADGLDCQPTNATLTTTAATPGNLEDCDGDGVRRPDLPFDADGTDCDDSDPDVRPGAQDICSDARDLDCNPSTCPVDDRDPPVISNLLPASGEAIGCQTQFSLTTEDSSAVGPVTLDLLGVRAGEDVRLFFLEGSLGMWETTSLGNFSGTSGLDPGMRSGVITARDSLANEVQLDVEYDLRLARPSIDSMLPMQVGTRSAPFDVTIVASSPYALESIELLAIEPLADTTYDVAQAQVLGTSAGSPAVFNVDPTAFGAAQRVLLVPRVRDVYGNVTEPAPRVVPTPMNGELTVSGFYPCLISEQTTPVAARLLTPDMGMPAQVSMRDLLATALAEAAAVDPQAQLTQINAFKVAQDGRVDLDNATDFLGRWSFGFFNASTNNHMSVVWFTSAFATMNPVVDPNAGNIVREEPFLDPMALVDSPIATAAAVAAACSPLTASDDDSLLYLSEQGQARVFVSSATTDWIATATDPVTEISGCP